jgi:hypothetical protein
MHDIVHTYVSDSDESIIIVYYTTWMDIKFNRDFNFMLYCYVCMHLHQLDLWVDA